MKLGRKPDPERIRLRIKYGFTEKQAKRASRLFLQLEQCRDDAARRLLLGRGYEKMGQHYTRNTIEVSGWCKRCGRMTPHRVDDRRLGPCLVCLAKPTSAKPAKQEPERGLFDEGAK